MNYGLCRNSGSCFLFVKLRFYLVFLLLSCWLHSVTGQHDFELDTVNLKAHARALRCQSGMVYLGDNLGRCFIFNPMTNEVTLLNLLNPEIRDVEVNRFGLFWMQTGDTGKVVQYTQNKPVLFPKPSGKSVFFDGLALKDSIVFAMGDPVNGIFQLFLSKNAGQHWDTIYGVNAKDGETAYAASGSTVQIFNDKLYFVSGGKCARIFVGKRLGKHWKSYRIPYVASDGEGPYSLCVIDKKHLVVVGGNYLYPNRTSQVCFYSHNGGKSWQESTRPPGGYRSCVIHFQGVTYACGSNGLDFSTDGGMTWTHWLEGSFITMDVSSDEMLWLTTNKTLGLKCIEPIQIAVEIGN